MDVRRAQRVHLEVVLGDAVHGGGVGRSAEESKKDGGTGFH
ncbi:MAG: hypothetical protein ACYDCW_02030 [Acidithiobacillus ferrivorans]